MLQPLGMTGTLVYVKGVNTVPNRAFGTKRGDQFLESDQSSTSATQSDGGIYSNLDDLAKCDREVATHRLLTVAEMQPALTRVRLANGSEARWPATPGDDNLAPGKPVLYGFGWFLDAYAGRKTHVALGQHARLQHRDRALPAEKLTIIVLCNRTDIDASRLALQVAGKLP
jgi:CubicO group peptidase (beta-lactamase class C family)